MDGLAVASSPPFSSGLRSARQLQGPYSLPARLRFLAASLPPSVLCPLDYAPGPALSRRRAREYVRSSPSLAVALAEAAWRRRIPALFLWLGSTRPAPGAIFPPRSPALPTASPLTSDLRPLSSGLRPLILSF